MSTGSGHYHSVAAQYDRIARHGAYGTLAPHNRGGRKSEYVAAVFDAALLPILRVRRFASLLDFGCGTGIFSRQAAVLAGSVVGVDVSPGILAVAAEVCAGLSNVKLALTEGERLPFEDASFDCIVARETLCYVPEERLLAVFAELYRVLAPGGQFLVIDQVSESPRWQRHPATPHQVKRAPSSLRDSTARTGFELQGEITVRTPRFPCVYLAWSGLAPRGLIPHLARFEIAWHRRHRRPTRRWWDDLFLFRKPK